MLCANRLLLLVQTTIAFCLTQMLGGFFQSADVQASWRALLWRKHPRRGFKIRKGHQDVMSWISMIALAESCNHEGCASQCHMRNRQLPAAASVQPMLWTVGVFAPMCEFDERPEVSRKIEVFEYFGTASRSMFTMFELTLARHGCTSKINMTYSPIMQDVFCQFQYVEFFFSKLLARNWAIVGRSLQENVSAA